MLQMYIVEQMATLYHTYITCKNQTFALLNKNICIARSDGCILIAILIEPTIYIRALSSTMCSTLISFFATPN